MIGELALTEAEKRKEEGKKRYRLFVHVNGSLERACADAGEVLDWAGMVSQLVRQLLRTINLMSLFSFSSHQLKAANWASWARSLRTTSPCSTSSRRGSDSPGHIRYASTKKD